jgi:hypothetical protein
VPSALIQRNLTNNSTGGSFKMLKEVQAQGGVMRTVVAMKSTVMKISVHNRQQVRGVRSVVFATGQGYQLSALLEAFFRAQQELQAGWHGSSKTLQGSRYQLAC